jgi:DNA-binding transcriptional ArsR family regulator
MEIPHPIPPDLAELIAQRFRVISEPMRIRLLDVLREGEASVQELTEALGTTQQNVSKHLSILSDARIVAREKKGNRVYYTIADEGIFELCAQVCGSLQQQLSELTQLIEGRTAK